MDTAQESFTRAMERFAFLNINCYQHFYELFCYLYFPQCELTLNNMIPPCRETCEEIDKGCVDIFESFTAFGFEFENLYDCEYLPPKNGSI